MLFLSFLRAIKFSLQDTYRNIWLTLVTITILILALFSINMLLTVKVISDAAVKSIKEKIDINIFLSSTSKEEDILALKSRISNIQNVKDVVYISQEQALASFKEKHRSDPDIMEALQEIGKNPLSPTLVIKPSDTLHYNEIISSMDSINDPIIESKNFDDHKFILDKINSITDKVSKVGIIISSIFIVITILLVYNSIRVAIYTHRREIGIMRLVGASHWFIRLPFLISSFLYTLVGICTVILIFYPFLNLLQPYIDTFFINYQINIKNYFTANFIEIFGFQFVALVVVNMLASFLAVGKYSKV
jgi:cell division transport system permease protein